MIIKEMTATFGRLEKQRLRLGANMNILQAENEGGKSTWSAFLRAMLYGIPTNQRDKAGFLAEKNRYAPWSGAPMEGSMLLEWRGREILLQRKAKGANPFGRVQAVDAATGEPIPELSVDKPGEILLGVEREVFERSAFVGQAAITVDGAPALEKRIAALLTSGQEEVSFSQVQRQLKDWRNRRQHNKTGILPKLEEEMARQEALLTRAGQARLQEEESLRDLEGLKEEKARLEREKAIHRDRAEGEKWAHFRESCEEYLKAKEEYDGLAVHFQNLPSKEELLEGQKGQQELQTLASALRLKEEEFKGKAARMPEPVEKPGVTIANVAVILLCAVATAALCLLGGTYLINRQLLDMGMVENLVGRPVDFGTLQFLCAGVGILLGGGISALLVRSAGESRRREKEEGARLAWEKELRRCEEESEALRKEREEKMEELLRFVHGFAPTVTNEFGISAALSRALQGEDLLTLARERLESTRRVAQMIRGTLEGEQPPPPVTGTTRYSYQETVGRLTVALEEVGRRERMVAAAQGELRSLGDVDAIAAALEANREEYQARQEELLALDLAMEAMEEANNTMQARFSPELNRRAGALMSDLTGGKYDKLTVTRTFEAAAQQVGEILPHSVLSLSQGTADQLYLAVRLAVCDLALPEENRIPLVLDDALIHFDDSRMGLALEHLLNRSKEQQILLLSCHSREREYLKDRVGVTALG